MADRTGAEHFEQRSKRTGGTAPTPLGGFPPQHIDLRLECGERRGLRQYVAAGYRRGSSLIMVVLGSMIENQARQEIRDAHHQWDEGDRSGAIAAYRDLYRTRFTVAGSDAKLVARLADAAMEQGDAGRSGELLQRVIELHADKFLEREDSLAKAAEIREKQEERHRLLAEKRAREREEQAEEARIEAAAKQLVELGEKSRGPKPQQSAWDGVPTAVRAWMEKNANDPDSIEYIETSDLVPMGFVWVARVKYRGTNAFGGKVVEERYFHIVGDDMGGAVVDVRNEP